ncbi:hypothetical protein MSPP1_002681 [Malassezia sp. CBS 17886]|nr:hypothetical protein MSPP1_002681 [Malassezia sp. CBS 17886]
MRAWRDVLFGHWTRSVLYDLVPPVALHIALLPFAFVPALTAWLKNRGYLCFVLAQCVRAAPSLTRSLVFYPGGNTVGAHFELVVLGVVGSTLWLALGFLIVCVQVWIESPDPIYTTDASRGLAAAYLFVTFFLGGCLWSWSPRLRSAMRVGMFLQTWILTSSESKITSANFTTFFFPVLVCAGLSLLVNILFPRTAHTVYYRAAGAAMHVCETIASVAFHDFRRELQHWRQREQALHNASCTRGEPHSFLQSAAFADLRKDLRREIVQMRRSYAAAQHEIAWSRVPVLELEALLPLALDVQTWMACGLGLEIPPAHVELPHDMSRFPARRADEESAASSDALACVSTPGGPDCAGAPAAHATSAAPARDRGDLAPGEMPPGAPAVPLVRRRSSHVDTCCMGAHTDGASPPVPRGAQEAASSPSASGTARLGRPGRPATERPAAGAAAAPRMQEPSQRARRASSASATAMPTLALEDISATEAAMEDLLAQLLDAYAAIHLITRKCNVRRSAPSRPFVQQLDEAMTARAARERSAVSLLQGKCAQLRKSVRHTRAAVHELLLRRSHWLNSGSVHTASVPAEMGSPPQTHGDYPPTAPPSPGPTDAAAVPNAPRADRARAQRPHSAHAGTHLARPTPDSHAPASAPLAQTPSNSTVSTPGEGYQGSIHLRDGGHVPLLRDATIFSTEMYALALHVSSLLQLAHSAERTLRQIVPGIQYYLKRRLPRFFIPHVHWRGWFSSSSGLGIFQAAGMTETFMPLPQAHYDAHSVDDDDDDVPQTSISPPRDERDGEESIYDVFKSATPRGPYRAYAWHMARASTRADADTAPAQPRSWVSRAQLALHRVCRLDTVVELRVRVSNAIHACCRSRHVQFGVKLAGGAVLLFVPSFLSAETRHWWAQENAQWMVISYIWCLEASTGDSIRVSLFRIVGTIAGVVGGLVAFEISRGNRYALAVLVVLLEIPTSLLRLRTRYVPVGAVMGVTTPVVALVPYTHMSDASPGAVALNRGYMICLGIAAALVVNFFFWPYHARVRLSGKLASTTSTLQLLYLNLTRQMLYVGYRSSPRAQQRFKKLELQVRHRLHECSALVCIMGNELSLIPKPTGVLTQVLVRLHAFFDAIVALRMYREHGLEHLFQSAVWDVADLRQELASAVLLTLWIIGQSLLTRQSLPQFLPSTRSALDDLTAALALRHGELSRAQGESLHSWRRVFDAPRLRRFPQDATPPHAAVPGHIAYMSGTSTPTPAYSTDALFFLLTEHALIAQAISSLEALLHLTRFLLGEMQLVDAAAEEPYGM